MELTLGDRLFDFWHGVIGLGVAEVQELLQKKQDAAKTPRARQLLIDVEESYFATLGRKWNPGV